MLSDNPTLMIIKQVAPNHFFLTEINGNKVELI